MNERPCNWCGNSSRPLAYGKPYCVECQKNCKRECGSCHRPFNDESRYFDGESKTCITCRAKGRRAAESKRAKRDLQEDDDSDSSSSDSWSESGETKCKKKQLGTEELRSIITTPQKKKTSVVTKRKPSSGPSKKKLAGQKRTDSMKALLAVLNENIDPSSITISINL